VEDYLARGGLGGGGEGGPEANAPAAAGGAL